MNDSCSYNLFLQRDAVQKLGLCRHVVSVRPSVCLSRSWTVETNKHIFEFFSDRRAATPRSTFCTIEAKLLSDTKLRAASLWKLISSTLKT